MVCPPVRVDYMYLSYRRTNYGITISYMYHPYQRRPRSLLNLKLAFCGMGGISMIKHTRVIPKYFYLHIVRATYWKNEKITLKSNV